MGTNTATVLNCVSAIWQDEERQTADFDILGKPVFRRWQRKLQSSMELREIYRTRSPYDRKYLLSRTLWLFQRVQTKFRNGTDSGTGPSGMQRRPRLRTWKYKSLWYHRRNNRNMSSRKMWGPTCPVFFLPYPAKWVGRAPLTATQSPCFSLTLVKSQHPPPCVRFDLSLNWRENKRISRWNKTFEGTQNIV